MNDLRLNNGASVPRLLVMIPLVLAGAGLSPNPTSPDQFLRPRTQLALQAQPAAAACVRSWVDHEAAIEDALRTSKVDRFESVPVGVTKPKRVFFAPGAVIRSGAWKPLAPGFRRGFWESYKSEIAAYELDKLLGMHMVPPAVERELEDGRGAMVLWLDNVKGWDMRRPARGPEPEWTRQISRMKLFDHLIANIDRNQGNLLYDADWHLLLIDHSRAFTTDANTSKIAAIQTVDERLWDRINALTRDDLQRALGPWLEARAIDAILTRREKMRADIDKVVAKLGKARVFLK
jgi:hypothetical protein